MAKKRRSAGEGCLRRRPNGIWELTITLPLRDPETGKPKYRSFYASTQAEVKRKRDEYMAQQSDGLLNGDITVSKFGEEFLEHHVKFAKIAPATADSYGYTLRLINHFLGDRRMRDLKTYNIEQFLLELQETGYSASTISKVRGLLFQMFQSATANDVVKRNVVAFVPKMRYEKATPKECFSAEEVTKLFQQLGHDKMGLTVRLMIATGLRKQEVLALSPRSIAEDGSYVVVDRAVSRKKGTAVIGPTKTGSSVRIVPIPTGARQYALQLRNSTTGDLIWESSKKAGNPIDPSHFDDLFRRAIETVEDVRVLTPHCCRHTYVSQMQALGVDLNCISELVGHASIKMTIHYLHIPEDVKQEAVDKMNVLF